MHDEGLIDLSCSGITVVASNARLVEMGAATALSAMDRQTAAGLCSEIAGVFTEAVIHTPAHLTDVQATTGCGGHCHLF